MNIQEIIRYYQTTQPILSFTDHTNDNWGDRFLLSSSRLNELMVQRCRQRIDTDKIVNDVANVPINNDLKNVV